MTSTGNSELKKQIINEVSRVHSSNLKRVESSSGMKTIFSSDDYNNKKSQPKPKFHRGHHRGHQTPQSPGKNRIKVKHNEHKGISADLFEKNSPVTSRETETRSIQADFVSSGISFTEDPLATSTLRPDTSTHSYTSDHNGGNVSSNQTHVSHQQTVTQRSEETLENDINENKINAVISSIDNNSLSSTSSLARTYIGHSGQSTLPTSIRGEAEMTLPDSSILQSEGTAAAESNMTEEDHAIQALITLAEGQEAEMNQLNNPTSYTYNTELSQSASNQAEGTLEDIYANSNSTEIMREGPGRSGLNRNTTIKHTDDDNKSIDEYNTYFDLKELTSSTPQTGSMHEDTASEIDSVHSGTGQRLERLDNLTSKDISIEASLELNSKPDSPEHSHTNIHSSNVNSANTEIYSNLNSMEIYQLENSVYSQNGDLPKPVMNGTEDSLVETDSQGKRIADEPSQEDIDDTHRRFDQILADMSTSLEEDFTMAERSVSDNLSSEADVVVHTNQDDQDTSRNHTGESDFAQEFTHLESSFITTQVDNIPNNSTLADTKNDSDQQANNGKDISLLELSRLHTRSSANEVVSGTVNTDVHNIETLTETKTEVESSQSLTELTEPVVMEIEETGGDSGILLKTSHEQNTSLDTLDLSNGSLHMTFDSTKTDDNKEEFTSDKREGQFDEDETVKQISSVVNAEYEADFSESRETNLENETTSASSEQTNSPRYLNISEDAQSHTVYSEAYENEQIDRSYKTSVSESESSRVYETIEDDEISRRRDDSSKNTEIKADLSIDKIETSSERSSMKSPSFSTGRLSPIGAEVNSSESTTWDNQKTESTNTSTVITTSHATRSEPVVTNNQPVIAGSYLSKLKSGPMKSKSDYQSLSETVNVKGLAKHLEKSLDFSKMVRNPKAGDPVEETKPEAKKQPLKVKTIDEKNPKAAFGLVLSEIFKKNKEVNIEDENTDEKPYRAYHLRPTSPPLTTTSVGDNKKSFTETRITDRTVEETIKTDKTIQGSINTDKTIQETVNTEHNNTVTDESRHHDLIDDVKTRRISNSSYTDTAVTHENRGRPTSSEGGALITESYEVKITDTNMLNNEMTPQVVDNMGSPSHEQYLSQNTSNEEIDKASYTRDVSRDNDDHSITVSTNNTNTFTSTGYNTDFEDYNGRNSATVSSLRDTNRDMNSDLNRSVNMEDSYSNGSTSYTNSGFKTTTIIKGDFPGKLSTSYDTQDVSDSEQEDSFVSITTLPDNENNLSDLDNFDETSQSKTEEKMALSVSNYGYNSDQEEVMGYKYKRDSVTNADYDIKRDSINISQYDKYRDSLAKTDNNNKRDTVDLSDYKIKTDSVTITDSDNQREGIHVTNYSNVRGSVDLPDYNTHRDHVNLYTDSNNKSDLLTNVIGYNNQNKGVNITDYDNHGDQSLNSSMSDETYTSTREEFLVPYIPRSNNTHQDPVNLNTNSDNKRDLLTSVNGYNNQNTNTSDYNNEGVNIIDYDNHRDRSLNSSMSEETYTSTHEEFLVPIPRSNNNEVDERVLSERRFVERVMSDSGVTERVQQNDNEFPSYRERFFDRSLDERDITTTKESLISTNTFLREPGELNVTDSGEVHFDSSLNSELQKRSGTEVHSTKWAFQQQSGQNETDLTGGDTVQGSSVSPALNSVHLDYSLFSPALGTEGKPAKQLHGYNINIVKKEDRSDHVTGSSSSQPVYVKDDVTREWDKTEEFVTSGEKLSESAYSSNFTSESKPSKHGGPLNDSRHSLFYDSFVEDVSGGSDQGHLTPPSRRYITGGNKNNSGNMAYLLTGKERTTAGYNRSGRSTPQRKDLYVEEDILVSPTAVDERRSSHSSRDYLADNHGEQNFFHFNMNSPSNYDREGTEARVENIQHVERSERKPIQSEPQQFEPLPDTYIGTAKAPTRVPIRIEAPERRPVEVSQTSSKAYLKENVSPNYRTSIDVTDSGGKRSEHTRTEKVTSTTHTSSQKHNGTNGNHITTDHMGYPQQSNVIRIKTHSTGPESSRRERRNLHITSRAVSGKPQADDNISISSLSSQSSTSELNKSHEMSGSRIHHRVDNRRIDNNRRVQQVNTEYISDGRVHSSAGTMPNHVKTSSNNRVYHSGKIHPDQENRSAQDVQYLIKSLERDTKQARRPIPGMVGDAFSYHVTSSGKENKSSSRNNQVNEVDVTSREAMLDRESKGPGSSHIIRRFKEERTVEDVTPNSTVHLSMEPNQSNRSIVLQNGQASDRPIVFHPPSSLGRSDSDRTSTYERSGTPRRLDDLKAPETTYYVDSSGSHSGKVRSEKIRLVNKEKKHHKGHSVSSDDNSSDEEGRKRRVPKSGKVSTVLYDFSSNQHPSLANVVHLEGAKTLKSQDQVHSQGIYSTARNTDKPFRARSSSESSMSDHGHYKKGTVVNKTKSDQLNLTHDRNRPHNPGYKSENVFYEHYEVKRDNPMYQDRDKIVYVSPNSKHDTRNSSKKIYIDSKSHSPTRHQLSSSFSSISPTGSPTPEDKHVTTVSFDESFNRKRSASPVSTTYAYQPKMHVKKHRVVKTDEQIIRPAESDNELYVRGSRPSPYHVVVKGDKHRGGRYSDTDESFYSDSRTSGSHRSTINISKAGGRRPDPEAPAVMSIPLTNEPVAMTIPAVHETKYVTNKSERMELKRSASMDSIRDMVDYPVDRSFRSERMLNNSSETHASPELRSPNSPYVSTITILNRKLNVDPGTTTEVISSDDDIRYRSQLNPVKEEVVYATKEAPRETKQEHRSEKHTTYTTYEEYRDTDNFEYVVPKTIRQERQIPIREEHILPVRQDRARAVRNSLHEKFTNMNYEQNQEPQQVEQKSSSDLKVVRGQFVIRNSMDIELEEGDSLTLDDNINVFDNSFTMNKENPLYQSDPDIYNKFESETIEQRTQRIRAPMHEFGTKLSRDEVDAYRTEQPNIRYRQPFSPTHTSLQYDSHDLDVPYAEGDFGDGYEDIIRNTRQAAVKSAPNKKKQNLSQLLLSKLAQIDSKDITQHIDVEHHNEEIYGDIKFIHADGSKSEAMDTTNFDSVSEHIDLMLKEGKALITIKVTAERIIPVDYEFNVWRKSQAIVTRNIEIDLKANDQRRRLYEHVMETTPRKSIGTSSTGYQESNEAVLSSKDTLKLFSRLLSVAEKDDQSVERDEVTYETQHRDRSDSLPSLSNADMLY